MSGREFRSRSLSGMNREAVAAAAASGDDHHQHQQQQRQRDRDSSRDSSSSREVRCGCQYYQTDSLLPERQTLVGTRPASRQSQVCTKHDIMIGDHEYEPINPMAAQPPAPPPVVKVATDPEVAVKKGKSSRITYIDNDPNFIHIPLHGSDEEIQETYLQIPTDDQIVISQDADADADAEEEQEDDQEEKELDDEDLSAQELQSRMEERFFAPTPTTTESRTDCEMNTSNIDSSAIEDLPLKRESRRAGSDAKGFQQRIRSHAGRLRTKFRSIQKPKISLPDRPKFHLPERPKFNLPERPKFKMPDRPKISLPERPKFNLPDRPKFSLPDRPKFNMPQRPKISMPNFGNLGKARTSSSLRRPLRDRNQYQSSAQTTVGSKKNIFDSLNFRTYPRFFNKKKRIAEENARIRGQRAMTPPPRMETDSIPSSPASRKGPFGQTWVQRYRDIKYADDENRSLDQSDKRSASLKPMSSFEDDMEDDSAPFRDPDFAAATTLDETKRKLQAISAGSLPDSDKEQRSSGSSSARHRVGVLEEIDADEFFLRQKGLSREDVDVSRYLSLEIRDAFRSPQNALARLDTELYDDEDVEACEVDEGVRPISAAIQDIANKHKDRYEDEEEDAEFEPQPQIEPKRPSRSRSLKSKRSSKSKSSLEMKEENANYNTYPPVRPSRSRKQSMQSNAADRQSVTNADIKDYEMDMETCEYDETCDEPELERRAPSIPSFSKQPSVHSTNEFWPQDSQPPLPPKRRKSTKDLSVKDNESMIDEICPDDEWLDEVNAQVMVPGEVTALQIEPKAIIVRNEQHQYDSPPVPPIRKARSRATSLADEDRTSRGCESLVSEAQSMPVEDFPVAEDNDAKDNFGYATVEKPEHKTTITTTTTAFTTLERPQRQKKNKPSRPPPPSRRKRATTQMMNLKNQGIHFFFTYPRRAMKSLHKDHPVRPIRNYSTLGPSRPPRRSKVFKEPVYAEGDGIPFMDESEKETLDSSTPKIQTAEETDKVKDSAENKDTPDEIRDLQSGDIIEKMKGRPLPAPPRPPRKSRTEDQLRESLQDAQLEDISDDEVVVSEKINIQILPSDGRKTPLTSTTIERSPVKEVVESITQVEISETNVSPSKEIISETKLTPAKEIRASSTEKSETKLSPSKEIPEVKQDPEKKEGPFSALKEMISQKKREFFEPKKETSPTSNKQAIVEQTITVETKTTRESSPLFKIIPLKADEQTLTSLEEASVSTQTDPLPEGYLVEEVQQASEEVEKLRATTPIKIERQSTPEIKTESPVPAAAPESQVQVQTVIEKRIVVVPDQDTEVSFLKAQKLQVAELDVEKINVNELQANKITVSNVDSMAMQVSEITSKAGNLVISGIELPPEFLQSLIPVVTHQQTPVSTETTVTQPEPPTKITTESVQPAPTKIPPTDSPIPPPPVVVYPSQTPIVVYPPQTNLQTGQQTITVHPAHIPHYFSPEYVPPPIPRTRSPPRDTSRQADVEEEAGSLMPVVKRRHHHSHKHSDLSTDEEAESSSRRHRSGHRQLQEQPTAGQLTRQLVQIWRNSAMDGVAQVVDGINRVFPEGEKRKDAQTAVCIILVLIAGLMLLGFGQDKTIHHHHWDFQFPPPQ